MNLPLIGEDLRFQDGNSNILNQHGTSKILISIWASIPKVVGSIPAVARHIFQACPVWIYMYTQSNITNIILIYVSCFYSKFLSKMKNNPSNLRDRQVYMHDSQISTAMLEYGFKLMILLKPGKYNIRHVITGL